ncbi:tRNA (guanine(37)-N1)-methyltransferase-like isoform X2 [Penaeus japonicus]|uniref:tRNA (guanine(37)-N1)-methyltransferase-like isoform X2 n=1 Tax=Penaeus japonicus TaxID=27405 RepID=UPI001C71034F|nr:tRNA (guanine(37)-N1)-methyltransferase-like isoform X2 [Penaeus japonicus]
MLWFGNQLRAQLKTCCFSEWKKTVNKHSVKSKITLESQNYRFYQTNKFHTQRQVYFSHFADSSTNLRKYLKYSLPLSRLRSQMDVQLLLPPLSVRGMQELNREAFQKTITVPQVIVESRVISQALKKVKRYLLKLEKLKPVETTEDNPEMKRILLNPLLVKDINDIKVCLQEMLESGEATVEMRDVVLNYDNWKAEDILRAVLPENQEAGQSYSIIGHILHLNLREHVLPYKTLIGQVLLEKIQNISLVVNKTNNIDSTYRNFQMEVLAGSGDTEVTVKENGSSFTLDFAKVYWNPRLSTEHERIVKKLNFGDVLYDVMAGIGPFAIPVGRKQCSVFANDLNPHSYKYLEKNSAGNKVTERVKCFNLDGNEFIKTVVKEDLLKKWKDPHFCGNIHITMNLPALAVEFLPSFNGLFEDVEDIPSEIKIPLVHVYMFTPDTKDNTAIAKVAEQFGLSALDDREQATEDDREESIKGSENSFVSLQQNVEEVFHVRQVAPNKAMMRVSFRLSKEILMGSAVTKNEPPCKKLKVEES